ncbi:uncharacterized protein MONOS_8791 [Monocercomonoides exilis]|uniref:uncharacterized protein n=1 Tax=Monocercomonoides exilis TaxID=2049356 RepID=UPI003559CA72|nr:hypothetical protein MONOS_8791 [Monocercomonoides exilis]|eukprot:MONOS_8791.1-p1 / transcript=MONOS_8791.1 / gene=MONOS_8791 / organism=Monocercomonoides_exilis_PA203 / gene_product=unspecified product / transcript_product=unspecified product / location=Mono_scaffold00341:46580-48027(+) / protein_length=440 / sequence_SO=supercontig / SO=protein_coding / is_pseudo=false
MEMKICCKPVRDISKMPLAERFSKLISMFNICSEAQQMVSIKELNTMMEKMEKTEFNDALTVELFNKINGMIGGNKIIPNEAIILIKQIGYWKAMKIISNCNFKSSLLSKRFELIISKEKNEKLLADLCECYLLLYDSYINEEMNSTCLPCLLKVASDKEESPEAQKEVELALLALSEASRVMRVKQEDHLTEVVKIIVYHEEHHNLTKLAFQSAWRLMIFNLPNDVGLQFIVVNMMNFAGVAKRELEELAKSLEWKRKEEGKEKSGAESGAAQLMIRWFVVIDTFFVSCSLFDKEYSELIRFIVELYRAVRENEREILDRCNFVLFLVSHKLNIGIDTLMECGVLDVISEELRQLNLEDKVIRDCLSIYLHITRRLSSKCEDETEEEKRKIIKKKMAEKIEEEGLEDIITSLHETFDYYNREYDAYLSLNISEYFVNL